MRQGRRRINKNRISQLEKLPTSIHQRIAFFLFFKRYILDLALTSSTMLEHLLPILWEDPWNLKYSPFKKVNHDHLLLRTLETLPQDLARPYPSYIKFVSSLMFPCDWSNELFPHTLALPHIPPPPLLLEFSSPLTHLSVKADTDLAGRLTTTSSVHKFWHWFLRHPEIQTLKIYSAQVLFHGLPQPTCFSNLTHLTLQCHVPSIKSAHLLSQWFALPQLIELKLIFLSPLQAIVFEPLLCKLPLLSNLKSCFLSPCDDTLSTFLPDFLLAFYQRLPEQCLFNLELKPSSEYSKKHFYKSFIPYFQSHSLPRPLHQLHIHGIDFLPIELLHLFPCSHLYLYLLTFPSNLSSLVPFHSYTQLTWSPMDITCLSSLSNFTSFLKHVAFSFPFETDFYLLHDAIHSFVEACEQLKSIYWTGPCFPFPCKKNDSISSSTLSNTSSSSSSSISSTSTFSSNASTLLSKSSSSRSTSTSSSSIYSCSSSSSLSSTTTLDGLPVIWETYESSWEQFIQYRELDENEESGSPFSISANKKKRHSSIASNGSFTSKSSRSLKEKIREAECYLSYHAIQTIKSFHKSTPKSIKKMINGKNS